jgi:hypothetical protein
MIKRLPFETNKQFEKRSWFIKNYSNTNPNVSTAEVERLSEIWANMITLKCRYNVDIEKDIHQFVKNNK